MLRQFTPEEQDEVLELCAVKPWAKPTCPVVGTYNRVGRDSGATIYDFASMDIESVRAKPLTKAPRPDYTLGQRQERVAAMAYQIRGCEGARDYIVDHHRPMVANMARKFYIPDIFLSYDDGGKLGTLIEYGVMGLREAAEPWQPSERYKDKIVGFATGNGASFAAYAKPYAYKWMRDALNGVELGVKPQFKQEVTGSIKTWVSRPWLREPPRGASSMMAAYYAGDTFGQIGKRHGRSAEWARKEIQKEFARLANLPPRLLPPYRKKNKIYVSRQPYGYRLTSQDRRSRYSRRQDPTPKPVLLASMLRVDADREWHNFIEEWLGVCKDGALATAKLPGHLDRRRDQDKCKRQHDLWRPPCERGITWDIYISVSKEDAVKNKVALQDCLKQREAQFGRNDGLTKR
jgi:hypothetical protein